MFNQTNRYENHENQRTNHDERRAQRDPPYHRPPPLAKLPLAVWRALPHWLPAEPFIPVPGDKFVLAQVRIGTMHAVDFLALTGAERLIRIQTPDAFEQALPAQHFVDAGNTAGVVVGRVEKSGVGVSD